MDESITKGVKKLANLLGKSEEEILSLINKKKEEMGGLINDYGALSGVASDFGVRISELTDEGISFSKIKDVLTKKETSVNVIGRVKRIFPIKEFQRKDGTTGKVARIIISDETGEIPVVLWDGHSEIANRVKFNDIVRIIKGNTRVSSFNDIERVEINLTTFSTVDINPEIDDVKTKIPEISEHIFTIKEVKEKVRDENERIPVSVIGRIISNIESDEFERVDGSKGVRSPFFIEDETGTIRVIVWDDMKKCKDKGIDFGSTVKIRGIAKKGMFDVEISTDSAGNVEKSNVDLNLPELKRMGMQALKIGEIYPQYDALTEDEKRTFSLTTKGVITRNFGVKEFEGIQGNVGKVGSFIINDGTGSIRVVLWDEAADFADNVSEGDAVEIKNGKIKNNMENYEIHINKNKDINLIDKEEFANVEIPSSEVVEKKISELNDGDRNVKLVVKIADIDTDQRLTYPACPTCGRKVVNIGSEWYCERCGTSVEPVQKLMLKIIGTDVNGDEQIKIVLFGNNVEKITGMDLTEILNLVGEFGEQTVIEKVKAELEGSVKTLIGHTKFNKNFAEMVFYVDEIV